MSKDQNLTIKIKGDSSDLQNELNSVTRQTQNLENKLSSIAKTSAVTFTGLTAAITGSILAFRQDEQAIFRTQQVLTSTGMAAGITAEEVANLSQELQDLTTFSDGSIQSAQNLLLTFTNIGKETFPRATEAVLDLATAMDVGLKEASIQVGKALNDPIQGITALTRVGIQFTDQQKALIEELVETNKIAEAQAIILKELERQMGGAAKAAAQGTGAFLQLKEVLGNIASAIGGNIFRTIEPFIVKLKDISKTVRDTNPVLLDYASKIILAGAALTGLLTILGGVGLAVLAITKGLAAIGIASATFAAAAVAGFVAVAAGVAFVVKNIEAIQASIQAVQAGFTLFGQFIERSVNNIKIKLNELNIALKEIAIATLEAFPTGTVDGFINKLTEGIRALRNENLDLIISNKLVSQSFNEIFDSIRAENAREELEKQAAIVEEERLKALEADAIAKEEELLRQQEHNTKKLEQEQEFQAALAEQRALDKEILQIEAELNLLDEEFAKEEERERLRQHLSSLEQERTAYLDNVKRQEFTNAKQIRAAQRKDDKERLEFQKKFGQDSLDAAAQLGQQFLKEGSKAQKALFLLQKSAAIGRILVNTQVAASQGLATPPAPNIPLAGLALAKGAVQLAAVVATTFGAQKGALVGDGSSITASGDRFPFMLERGELVVPRRNFDEVVTATARERGLIKEEGATNKITVEIGFQDNAAEILTASQFENATLGTDRR